MKRILLSLALLCVLDFAAFAQGSPPLTVQEADGSPRKNGITKIVVTNGSLTISGTTATITTGAGGGLTVGTTTIASGTNTRVLYNNAGVLGEYPVSGSGNAVLSASPTLTGTLTAALITSSRLHTITQGTANEAVIASTGYSLTGSSAVSIVDLAGTLNTSGSPDVFALRVTDTARGGSTKFFNIYGGASGTTSAFSVDRLGVPAMGDGTSGQPVTFATGVRGTMFFVYGNGGHNCLSLNSSLNTNWFCVGSGSGGGRIVMPSTATFGWQSSTTQADAAPDAAFTRSAAATIQMGLADAATATAQTLKPQGVVAGTSNVAGADWTLQGSVGTGTGAGGKILFKTAPAGGSGSSQNTQVTALTIDANSHLITGGSVPTIGGSCGTSPSIVGTDHAGKVTSGSVAPSSCTVTFNKSFSNAPACIAVNETTSNLLKTTSTTTTVVLAGTMVAGDVLAYVCSGW